MTAALAFVLCSLCGFTLRGAVEVARATTAQSRALVRDETFAAARNAVSVQEMNAREYQLEPSALNRSRYVNAANGANDAVGLVMQRSSGTQVSNARRLTAEQSDYRRAADRLIDLVASGNSNAILQDRLLVAPAYFTLQRDIDNQATAYHAQAQRSVARLRHVQADILVVTILGFALGLALVAMIWRTMLGYQRRLLDQAAANQHQALHDPLTGLPNRLLFERELSARLHAAALTASDDRMAVMLIDLNGFKGVNDTFGHHAGDQVLIEAGRRLRTACHDGDTVARLGDDEFAMLLPNIDRAEVATEIAERVTGAMRRNYVLPAGSAAVSGSVGLVLDPDGVNADDVLRKADAAMYRAKTTGKGVAVYDPRIDADEPNRMALFADLRALLDGDRSCGDLVLAYQPQVNIAHGVVVGAEALVRWQHPSLGLLQPHAFLPAAEQGGLEVPMTYYLIRSAIADVSHWDAGSHPSTVAVNIPPRCLLDDAFVDEVRRALADFRLPVAGLRLEITESGMTTDPDRARGTLRMLHETGIHVSIDDFGTGYRSLGQLKRMAVDELKIDRTFIQNLATDPSDIIMVRTAVELGHKLGLVVTAEGVEDLDALAVLRDLGCDNAQGFVLGHPVPSANLADECRRAEDVARNELISRSHVAGKS